MKNMLQLSGSIELINALLETLVQPICGFQNAFEFEDLDDLGMIRVYAEHVPAANYRVFVTSLYYRLQDKLFETIDCNVALPEPEEDVFRITASAKQAQKVKEDFFIYNGIENVAELVYPLSVDGSLAKIELIAVGLTEDELNKLNKQGKTTVKAAKINQRITKIGDAVHTTGRIMANDVVNPLAKAATKTTATIVAAGAKTIVDCGLIAAAEIAREAATFNINEIKERQEVKSLAYSWAKFTNQNKNTNANKNRTNNFNF